MAAYFLAAMAILIAFVNHWLMPKHYWKTTLISAVTIFIVTSAGLLFVTLHASVSQQDKIDWLIQMCPLLAFFALLISVFVGWFLRVVRPQ